MASEKAIAAVPDISGGECIGANVEGSQVKLRMSATNVFYQGRGNVATDIVSPFHDTQYPVQVAAGCIKHRVYFEPVETIP
ncbi:hypothetical protein [Sphingomonas sp. RB1R13]|uniref:hypothetical protein n=1 Tax=Sphingomonas sp. RB1R13 TaxID=3096159 RepID=UPI002FC5B9C2